MTMKKRITFGRRRKRTSAARKLLRELPNFFKLVFRLLRDPRVPAVNKALFGAVAVYMLTPVDLIPDFLGVLGWVDDLYLLGTRAVSAWALTTPEGIILFDAMFHHNVEQTVEQGLVDLLDGVSVSYHSLILAAIAIGTLVALGLFLSAVAVGGLLGAELGELGEEVAGP